MAAKSRTLKLTLLTDADRFSSGLRRGESGLKRFGGTLKTVGKAAGVLGGALAYAGGKVAFDAIGAASDLNETVAKTGEIFGEGAKQVERFAGGAAERLGQSKQQALDAAATFGTFGRAAGLAGDDLATFSTDFVSLASDLASFNNTEPQEAIDAIGSALRGEAEPMRRFGVLLDDATLRAKALELGLIETTKNALTPQQKVLAAQAAIYEQTNTAQGDFARTSGGLANQQRILAAEVANARAELGEKLLPAATKAMTFFREKAMPWLKQFGDVIGERVGPVVNGFASWLEDTLLPAAASASGIFRNDVAPVLRIVADVFTGTLLPAGKAVVEWIVGVLVPAIVDVSGRVLGSLRRALDTIRSKFDENRGKIEKVMGVIRPLVDFIVQKVAPVVANVLGKGLEVLATIVGDVIDAVGLLVTGVETLVGWFESVAGAVDRALGPLRTFIDTAGKALDVAGGVVSKVGGAVGGVIGRIPGLAHGGVVTGPTLAVVGEGREDEAVLPLSKLDRMLANAGGGGGVTINVTGTMLDPEGVARAVEDALDRAQRRRGGAARLVGA